MGEVEVTGMEVGATKNSIMCWWHVDAVTLFVKLPVKKSPVNQTNIKQGANYSINSNA